MKREQSKLTREGLVEILTMDGTWEEIMQALHDKELTEQELQNIEGLLLSDSKKEAKQYLDEIFKNLETIPSYETGKEEKLDWSDYRKSVVEEIENIQYKQFEYKDERKGLDEVYENYQHAMEFEISPAAMMRGAEANGVSVEEYMKSIMDDFNQNKKAIEETQLEIDRNAEQLEVKTAQLTALTLLNAQAKSMEAQARGREVLEATEPARKWLAEEWDYAKTQVHDLSRAIQKEMELKHNTKQLAREADNAGYHPIKEFMAKQNIKNAMHHLKGVNKAKEGMEKVEKKLLTIQQKRDEKLIKKANKMIDKQRSNFDKLNGMMSGRKLEGKDLIQITNAAQAREVLGKEEELSRREKSLTKQFDKYYEQNEKHQAKLDRALGKVKDNIEHRREEMAKVIDKFEQQYEDGEIKQGGKKLNKVIDNIGQGLEATQFDKDLLSPEMIEYMKEMGMGDYILGEKIDMRIYENPGETIDIETVAQVMEEQEVNKDNPDFEMEVLNLDDEEFEEEQGFSQAD